MTSIGEARLYKRKWRLRLICTWALIPTILMATPVGAATPETMTVPETPVVSTSNSNVNMAFDNADIHTIFSMLADLASLNVIIDPAIQGNISLTIRNVNVMDAIQIAAKSAQVIATVADGLLVVSPIVPQAAVTTSADATQVRVYSLEYADPTKVAEIAASIIPSLKVMGEETAKRVVARGTSAELAQFESFLQQFDKAGQQVHIEARVQEVSRQALKELGVSWSLPELSALVDSEKSTLTIGIKGLSAALDAMESSGDARLLAQPQITTISGETATIFVGDRVPVLLKGGETESDTVQYIEAGISLEITPRIGATGKITVHVQPQVSNIATWTAQNLPQVRTRTAETSVQVQDGQPIIIGGLIREEDRRNMARLPGLANLPIVGALFRSDRIDTDQIETIIILTPHIVKEQEDLVSATSYKSGVQSAFREQPATDTASFTQSEPQKTIDSRYPMFVAAVDVTAESPLASLALRWPLLSRNPLHIEASVAAPLIGSSTPMHYGLSGRADVGQFILQLSGYGLLQVNNLSADPRWEVDALVGTSMWRSKNWFMEPGIRHTWRVTNGTISTYNSFSMKFGVQF